MLSKIPSNNTYNKGFEWNLGDIALHSLLDFPVFLDTVDWVQHNP